MPKRENLANIFDLDPINMYFNFQAFKIKKIFNHIIIKNAEVGLSKFRGQI